MKARAVFTFLIPFAAVLTNGFASVTRPEFVPGVLRTPRAEPVGPPIPEGAFITVQESFVPGMLRAGTTGSGPPGPAPAPAPAYMEKPCDGTLSAACTSCNKLKVCVTPVASMDASNPRKDCPAATPHCSMSASVTGAVCQRTPDTAVASCIPAASPFPCTGVGFYPDPASCQVYHYCTAPGATAQDYDCPDGYKFTSKTNGCTLQANKCPTVTCPTTQNTSSIYQAYPDDTMYYVYCSYDMVTVPPSTTPTTKITPYMFSCGSGSTYNPATDQCVFKCTKEGNFVDTANPRQYHQCYTMAGKLVYRDKICMPTQKFDTTANACL